jgi:Tfp pilus assembly protein PilF
MIAPSATTPLARPHPRLLVAGWAFALIATLSLTSCGLSKADRNKLAQHQETAALYYGDGKYVEALQQVEKGLQIEPEDYKLHNIAGNAYLRQAELYPDRPRYLQLAERWFDAAGSMRSRQNHDRAYFFGYGRTQLLLGRAAIDRAAQLRQDAESEGRTAEERSANLARAEELEQNIAPRYLAAAEAAFEELIQRTELLRFAHFYLVQLHMAEQRLIAADDEQGTAAQLEAIESHAESCVERVSFLKKRNLDLIREPTTTPAREQELREQNDELDEMELIVRQALADIYFNTGRYAASAEQLDLVLTIEPRRADAYFNRARAYQALSDKDKAKHNYERFLVLTRLPQGDERVKQALDYVTRQSAMR